jgi:hypothetical protein
MFLIITPSRFSEALTTLKRHKESTGLLTSIITLEKIYQYYSGKDEAEKVKRCIEDYHRQQSIRYVMLVGDFAAFPVRYTVTDHKSDAAMNTAFYPTDLYYSALYKADGSFDDWDGNKNGYFGELFGECHSGAINVDNVSLEPVVAVGRIPVSTEEEVARYVSKVISYETNVNNETSKRKALLTATHDWLNDACKVNERIAGKYLTDYECIKMNTKECLCVSDRVLTSDKITDMINSGVDLVNYIGFGDPENLAIPGKPWTAVDAAQLTNSKLPVVCVSVGSTSIATSFPPYSPYTDSNGESHPGLNRGEIFEQTPPQPACFQRVRNAETDLATNLTVRTEHGAAAYIGGVVGMQMYEPTEYLFQSVQDSKTVGEAWQGMIRLFYKKQGLPGKLNQQYWFAMAKAHQPWRTMLFGDPSLRMRGAKSGEWFDQQITRTNIESSEVPAIGVLRDKLYMVWKSKTNANLWFSVYDGERWSAHSVTSESYDSSGAPALAAYKDKLYMVWKAKGADTQLCCSSFDGDWTPQIITGSDHGASGAPALAVFRDKLYMAWKGKTDSLIWFSDFDGTSWSPAKAAGAGFAASDTPSLAVYEDELYVVWKGKADSYIWFSIFNESNWTPACITSYEFETLDAPALAIYKGKLYMAWKGIYGSHAWYSVFNGRSWSMRETNLEITKTPVIAEYDDKLFIVWRDPGQQLCYSYFYESP